MPVLIVAGWGVVCTLTSPFSVSWPWLPISTRGGASPPGGQSLWWSWHLILSFIGDTLQQESRLMPITGHCPLKQPRGTWQLSGGGCKEQIHPLCLLEQTPWYAVSGCWQAWHSSQREDEPDLPLSWGVCWESPPPPGPGRVSGAAPSRPHMGSP